MLRAQFHITVALASLAIYTSTFCHSTAIGQTTPSGSFELNIGEKIFWDGFYVEKEIVLLVPHDPTIAPGTHWEYLLHVRKDGGQQLRVSLDVILGEFRGLPDIPVVQDPGGTFRLQILRDNDGDGDLDELSGDFTFGVYTAEAFVLTPVAGTYIVRVTPSDVEDRAFRMRAILEKPATGNPKIRPLLPNLRIVPPFEPTFITGTVGFGPGLHIPGAPLFSCMAEEMLDPEDGNPPQTGVCLHFSAGLENAGDGPLWIVPPDDLVRRAAEFNALPAHQVLFDSDGTRHAMPEGSAGEFRFHLSHGHYHYEDVYTYELLHVGNPSAVKRADAQLTFVGDGHKLGFNPADEMLTDWKLFYQERRGSHDSSQPGAFVALSSGWADIYEWNRSGQYVDFPVRDDGNIEAGNYVIRGTADAAQLLIETNELDNIAYAHIRVFSSGEIQLLERGYGSDPWDPAKIVLGPMAAPWDPNKITAGPITLE